MTGLDGSPRPRSPNRSLLSSSFPSVTAPLDNLLQDQHQSVALLIAPRILSQLVHTATASALFNQLRPVRCSVKHNGRCSRATSYTAKEDVDR